MESPHRTTNLNNFTTTHLPHKISTIPNFPPVTSNRILSRCEEPTTPDSFSSSRSSIQDRIERLYGSSAGFRIHKFEKEEKKESTSSTVPSGDDFPSVFRHLTPEFRHLLPLKPKCTLFSSCQNNNMKVRKISGDVVDCHMNNHSTDRLPAVPDRTSRNSEGTPSKSWYSLRNDIQSVGKTDSSPIKSITNNINSLDLNKNINPIGHSGEEGERISEPKKDGFYFLKVVETEVKKLEENLERIDSYLKDSEDQMTEEVKGKLLAASGKAKLLIRQKFHQFKGLCQKNIDKNCTDEFPTTDEDLAGFWDMVLIQVENVKEMFSEIEKLRGNEWKEVTESPKTISVRKKHPTPRVKSVAPSKTSGEMVEAANSKSKANEERRRQMRQALISKKKENASKLKNGSPNDEQIQIFM